ncbi:hypothetical protein [Methanoculleus chikugoensis]|uniref:hypothetical protein n=1 Tax=Methanoculleus chikugoensis TaxID=118126 RepID=UPI0006D21391|nr:hypothetical protein [Methanoculleus chikugoensis]
MQPEKTCGILSIRVIDYTQDRIEEHECIELTEAWSWIGRETVTWIDVVGGVPERDELVILGRQAGGIHPLTMEDITAPDQRPKVEEFGNYVAVIARMLSERGGRVASEQVSLIFGGELRHNVPRAAIPGLRTGQRAAQERTERHPGIGGAGLPRVYAPRRHRERLPRHPRRGRRPGGRPPGQVLASADPLA